MFIVKNDLVYSACMNCVKEMESDEVLDSMPPSYLWVCSCGYRTSFQVRFPMDLKAFENFLFQQRTMRTKEFVPSVIS